MKNITNINAQPRMKYLHSKTNCVFWKASGTMDLCVVWKTNRKKPIPDDKRWQNIGGVWWLEAKSKWTRKETYGEILRFFARFGLAAYIHDSHSGHLGEFPKLWLGTIACTDFTIPSNSFFNSGISKVFLKIVQGGLRVGARVSVNPLTDQTQIRN